jgi:hypothetical protein
MVGIESAPRHRSRDLVGLCFFGSWPPRSVSWDVAAPVSQPVRGEAAPGVLGEPTQASGAPGWAEWSGRAEWSGWAEPTVGRSAAATPTRIARRWTRERRMGVRGVRRGESASSRRPSPIAQRVPKVFAFQRETGTAGPIPTLASASSLLCPTRRARRFKEPRAIIFAGRTSRSPGATAALSSLTPASPMVETADSPG